MNPVDFEKVQLPESSSVRPLEIWEVKALLLATSRLDWRTCIYTGFYAGPQLVDAAYRLWPDIVKDEGGHSCLSFPGTERKAARRVRIHPAFLEHLNSLPRVNEFICPSLAALQRWTVDDQFAQIVEAAKLGPGVTFRCLRHTYARLAGVPVKRFDGAPPEAPMTFPDIRVPPLPCQLPLLGPQSSSSQTELGFGHSPTLDQCSCVGGRNTHEFQPITIACDTPWWWLLYLPSIVFFSASLVFRQRSKLSV
jgi:hypothetical protein